MIIYKNYNNLLNYVKKKLTFTCKKFKKKFSLYKSSKYFCKLRKSN